MRGHLDVEIAVAVEICDVKLSTRVRRFPRVGDSFGRSEPPVAGRERKTHEKSSVKVVSPDLSRLVSEFVSESG